MKSEDYKADWDECYGKPGKKPWEVDDIAPALRRFFEDKDNLAKYKECKILDVGCGDGSLCEYLHQKGYKNVKGIDVSEVIIEKCKSKQKEGLVFECKDIVNDSFDEEYDVVVCWFLLHHIPQEDVIKLVLNLSRICKKNGTLILSYLTNLSKKERESYVANHNVKFYSLKEARSLFSSCFSLAKTSKKKLLKDPDAHDELYPYQVFIMNKGTKEEYGRKIFEFKNKYLIPNSGIYDNDIKYDSSKLIGEMIDLLNSFSRLTQKNERRTSGLKCDVDELSEKDLIDLFNSLFRNVSRYICRRIEGELTEKRDVIILKMDSLLQPNHGSIFSATMYAADNMAVRPHCKYNDCYNEYVKSRAYELFLVYSRYLKKSNLPYEQQYTIHKHFADHPDLKYIAFRLADDKKLEPKLEPKSHLEKSKTIINKYPNYKAFLTSIFTEDLDVLGHDTHSYVDAYYSFSRKHPGLLTNKASSFSCFNLGVTGFESWGTLMIEGIERDVFDVRKIFFDDEECTQETKLLQEIKNIVFILKKIDYDYHEALADRKIKIEAIKSAVAALMSRNMSHNLGSHYLTNTKNYFRRRIDDKALADNMVLLNADYRGAAHLLQYMQERMDFIATIVSTDRYPLGSLNFKAEFFDELTNDDCGERHSNGNKKFEKNFLLQYLLHSEKYTRHGHTCDDVQPDFGDVKLNVQIGDNPGLIYTGLKSQMKVEQGLKMDLSKLRLAVPGGIMARHALFTLAENLLRNAAKHNKHNESNELILTIKVPQSPKGKCILSFFDNCKAISKDWNVLSSMTERFENIKIVDFEKNNVIDKTNKGLKEMLICALWLKNKDVAQTLYNIQIGLDKASNYLRVKEEDGNLCYELDLDIFEKFHFIELDAQPNNDNNTITLSVDQMLAIHADFVLAREDYFVEIEGEEDKKEEKKRLSDIFPRFRKVADLYFDEEDAKGDESIHVVKGDLKKDDEKRLLEILSDYNNYEAYKVLIDNPGVLVDYSLCQKVWNVHSSYQGMENDDDIIVYLDHYLNGGPDETLKKINAVPNALYVDSISGENFTSTLTTPDFLEDDVLRMKVIDSALTKIVLIDERIWEDCRSKWNTSTGHAAEIGLLQEVLDEIKNEEKFENYTDVAYFIATNKDVDKQYIDALTKYIDEESVAFPGLSDKEKIRIAIHVLESLINTLMEKEKSGFSKLLLEKKNLFVYTMPEGYLHNGIDSFIDISQHPSTQKECDFLSVHLGLIEKYLENNKEKSVTSFMDLLTSCFHPKYISVHSGRGNFSPELESGLGSYPFVSLSAIDAAFGNSKYLLSELFNNTNYYGKGNINHNKGIS